MSEDLARSALTMVAGFRSDAHALLARVESAPSRVIELNDTYQQLGQLGAQQDDLLRQALRCLEKELYRSAHVMAWAALMDLIESRLGEAGVLVQIAGLRPKWRASTLDEIVEGYSEYQLVDLLKPLGICSKGSRRRSMDS